MMVHQHMHQKYSKFFKYDFFQTSHFQTDGLDAVVEIDKINRI